MTSRDMTCDHVLGLIDAGAFADYPRSHLDAARGHAHACATCGPALAAAGALSVELRRLSTPALPPTLAAGVLARVAQLDEARRAETPPARAPLETGGPGRPSPGD